jgi:hypothetical protein
MGIEQKMAQAARLMEEAASELEKIGLKLNFEIRIKLQPPLVGLTFSNDNSPSDK